MLILSSFGLALPGCRYDSAIAIMFLALVSGVGRSLAFTSYNGLQFTDVAPIHRNGANNFNGCDAESCQGLGISLITVIIHIPPSWYDTARRLCMGLCR